MEAISCSTVYGKSLYLLGGEENTLGTSWHLQTLPFVLCHGRAVTSETDARTNPGHKLKNRSYKCIAFVAAKSC